MADKITFGSEMSYFTIKPITAEVAPPIPWWQIALIALAIVGGGTTAYYASRKKK